MAHRLHRLGVARGNPLRGFGLAGFALCLVAVVGLLSLVGGTPLSLILPIADALLIVGIVLIAWSALQGRTYAQDIQQMEAGHAWVQWHYDPTTWQQFAAADQARAWREVWQVLGGGVALGLGLGLIFALLGGGWPAVGLAVRVFAVAALLAAAATALAAHRRDTAVSSAGGEIAVSALGIYQPPGRYTPLQGFNLNPVGGRIEAGSPAELVLTTQVQGRYGPRRTDVRFPPGHEAEPAALLARFRAAYGWSA